MKTKFTLFVLLFLGLIAKVSAQIDSEFWFAVPEVTSSHEDRPVYLRMSTFDSTANVVIDMPANSGFSKITLNIPSNSTKTVELTSYLSLLENATPNVVTNQGIRIVSDQIISAYYDEASTKNPEIFTLKGRNGLGTEFYTPFQSDFPNGTFSPITAYSSIDIVATEDNTQIKINPTQNVVGHTAGTEYTVTLNKGQTYSARAIGFSGALHLFGTHIKSNKPIAVTIKDDSVETSTGYDLVGDQMVPINIIGTDYIAVKGFLNDATHDRLYFLATQDNTKIYLDGSSTPAYTLNAGKQQMYILTASSKYIHSSAPIYVFHLSGIEAELAGAILPQITCTGSYEMAFSRTTTDYFGIVLLIQNGMQDKFILNGSSSAITSSMFSTVPGSNNQWVSASIDLSSVVPVGTASRISNSASLFNFGWINGGTVQLGAKYGYFTDFTGLNIGADKTICAGDSVKLDAQRKGYSYLWSTGDTTRTIEIKREGDYSVVIKKNGCVLKDTMHLFVNPLPKIFLGNDTNICVGKSIKLDAGSSFVSYLWQNNATTQSITTDTTGRYWVKVKDTNTCTNRDTINVTVRQYPKLISKDTVFCDTYRGQIKVVMDQQGTGKWQSLATNPIAIQYPDSMKTYLTVANYGSYPLLFSGISIYGCAVVDTVKAAFHQKPTASFSMDSSKCYLDNVKLVYTGNATVNALYNWNLDDCTALSGSGQGPINVALGAVQSDKRFRLVVFEDGCYSDTAKQTLKVTPTFSMSSDTTAGCVPTTIHFSGKSNKTDVSYQWNFGDNTTSNLQNPTHQYAIPQHYTVSLVITAADGCQNAYSDKDMIAVYQIPTSKISLNANTCYPDTIPLVYTGNASDSANYNWSLGNIAVLSGKGQGPYQLNLSIPNQLTFPISLSVNENGCYSDTTTLTIKRNPHVNIVADPDHGCQPLTVNFDESKHESSVTYSWDFKDTQNTSSTYINPTHLFLNDGIYDVKLTAVSSQGCSTSKSKTVTVYKKPTAAFNLTPKSALLDNATITFENLSKFATQYQWNFGDSSKSTDKNPVYLYTTPGEFKVRLIAISENGCTDTTFDRVTVGSFFTPNAFAPNSNVEKNRFFAPVSVGMTLNDYTFSIFNRWGNKIFETHDTNITWDGSVDGGSRAAAGAYVWTVSYLDIRGSVHKHAGTVVLLR